ncbi:MAG: ABC transporter permease, partial [Candidatus Roizmanbacteria bacterium]
IKPSFGTIFSNNNLTYIIPDKHKITAAVVSKKKIEGKVAGIFTQATTASYLSKIGDATIQINPDEFLKVRNDPSRSSKLLGYTKRIEGNQEAGEYWGDSYLTDDEASTAGISEKSKPLGKWLKSKVLLWKEKKCTSEDIGCEQNSYVPLTDNEGNQITQEGYFAEISVQVKRFGTDEKVLGISTDASTSEASSSAYVTSLDSDSTSTDESTLINRQIASLVNDKATENVKTVTLPSIISRKVVVNKSLLQVLGIQDTKGVGKKIQLSFISTGNLTNDNKKIQSQPTEYSIIAVISDSKTPIMYVPINDLKQMGITDYSQVKLVINNQKNLSKARKQVEVLGFKTNSVADTVSQIESLFSTMRFVLGLLGIVALAVAALGMFNTLTVSLMERTHEVGMMKAIGMKSGEVQDLFLTESMIMGILGGVSGLVLGFLGGRLVSILLSIFSISQGQGFLDIAHIPFLFTLLIIILSVIVGVTTGIFPARRATKISALNALRYE